MASAITTTKEPTTYRCTAIDNQDTLRSYQAHRQKSLLEIVAVRHDLPGASELSLRRERLAEASRSRASGFPAIAAGIGRAGQFGE
jgi:hypothetical protein